MRRMLNFILRFLTRHLIHFEIEGMENIPRHGRLIISINHINFLDPLLACALVPREVIPLSKVENLQHPIFGPLARAYGAIPVRRGEADVRAVKRAMAVLNEEKALLIAPEGTRSGDGRLQRGMPGLALLALRTQSPVVPIGLVGQEKFESRLQRLRRTHVWVNIGRPFRFVVSEGRRISRGELREMIDEAMAELARLLPPENRGVYAEMVDLPRKWIQYVAVEPPVSRLLWRDSLGRAE